MIMTALPTGILAAPQQSPSAQVASSLLGLKVPFDMAFSHLELAAPRVGLAASAASTIASIVERLAVLVASAAARAAAYLSYSVSLQATMAARCAAVALSTVTWSASIKVYWAVKAD